MDCLGRCTAAFFFFSCFTFSISSAYKNFTVGDDSGWVYPALQLNVDYSKWASGKSFSLGDYLIFNYPDRNHSVVVTQNHTVYSSCDYEDSNDNDIELYGEPGTSSYSEVPLLETGTTYFFCGTYSGEHCRGGMRFAINVTHGEGLPPNLISPPPTEESPEAAPTDNSNSPPEGEESPPTSTLPATTDTDSSTDSNLADTLHPSTLKMIFIPILLFLLPVLGPL